MHSFLKRWAGIGLFVVTAGAVLSAACGGGGDSKTTPAATGSTPATTAAKTVATAASTKPSGTPTQAAAATASDAGQGATVTLVAKNTAFDKSELTAKPGDVTIVMDNQDPGIPHNLHVFKGTDSKGQHLGKTEIVAGPVKQTLKLNLTAGDYFLVCGVHPATG